MQFFEMADNDLCYTILNEFYCVLRLADSFLVLRCKIFLESFWHKALVMLPYSLVIARENSRVALPSRIEEQSVREIPYQKWIAEIGTGLHPVWMTPG
jgi:hypothetical protein